jgi:ABC-type dipeptide/oligopeptide/nickel transport system ATPase component
MSSMPLLRVDDLSICTNGDRGKRRLVDGASFDLEDGSALALVGESGSGKTLTSLAITRLLPPPLAIERGRVFFREEEVTAMDEDALAMLRGPKIAIVADEPTSMLNPLLTVGDQLTGAIRQHGRLDKRAAKARALELSHQLGIAPAEQRLRCYPHQLSSGIRKRVMIAIALACEPQLIVADEPTAGLDATLQAEVLDLLGSLREERGLGLVVVTRDLGIVAEFADRVAVFSAGKVVEIGPVAEVFATPAHTATRRLLASARSAAGRERGAAAS